MIYKIIVFSFSFLLFFSISILAQDGYEENKNIDIQHYKFSLELNDTTDIIRNTAEISIKFNADIQEFHLDLINPRQNKGMKVESVLYNQRLLSFTHTNNKLRITLPSGNEKGKIMTFIVSYSGIPADGLIIDKNKYGDRTFFGDNWPDRARNWLPTIDHPSDKATVEYFVTAPSHYKIIANGVFVEEKKLNDKVKTTNWKESVAIPTKVMVIGVAQFSSKITGEFNGINIESWVYPQNEEAGHLDYSLAIKPLTFFSNYIGPYPYEKLANVQSKTRYGGMENASAIFYYENSVTGKQGEDIESLIAHEVAHQWFGNSATEKNWHHIWLSEGFATYFTHLYMEHTYGIEVLHKRMENTRNDVINYAKKAMTPIIDTEVEDYNDLLNPNSYQKGGWVLHMLRRKLGDETFHQGIEKYYQTYKNNNATTEDLRMIMEQVSKEDLNAFFNQWLYQSGHPQLSFSWKNENSGKSTLTVEQHQKNEFHFPLEIKLIGPEGQSKTIEIQMNNKKEVVTLPLSFRIENIKADPNVNLLFEIQY